VTVVVARVGSGLLGRRVDALELHESHEALSMTLAGPVAMKPPRSTAASISCRRSRPISQRYADLVDDEQFLE
jgi:hypothetical protein